MLTVLVTNTKGGCGKTTLSTNLAGAFARSGFATVLADCDKQRSALQWSERRPRDLETIKAVDWVKTLASPPKGTQRMVVDAPAGLRRKDLEVLVKAADVIVLPILPSVFDENTSATFLKTLDELKPVRKGKRSVAVVGNRMRLRTPAAARLDRFLTGLGHPVVARLRESQYYVSAAERGSSIFDLASGRVRNILADWAPLLAFIDTLAAADENR